MAKRPPNTPIEDRIGKAAGILKLSKTEAGMNVRLAMKFAGLTTPETNNEAIRRRVYRKRDALASYADVVRNNGSEPAEKPKPYITPQAMDQGMKKLAEKVKKGNMRLTTRQAKSLRDAKRKEKENRKTYFKMATTLLRDEKAMHEASKLQPGGLIYKPKSAETICNEIFEKYGFRLAPRSVRYAVEKGHVGQSPPRAGRKGRIDFEHYKALCGAVESFCTITQASGTRTITRPELVRRINALVNYKEGPGSRTKRYLLERIEKDIGSTMELGKPVRVEQRRNKWSTHANIDMWYDSLKSFLIEHGFATENTVDVETKGELNWVDDTQGRRIANIDESGLVLDDTTSGKGGRPASVWYNPRLANTAIHAAHKNSFHCTLLAGTFASGEKMPEHFILPSDAKDPDSQGLWDAFIIDMRESIATYLRKGKEAFSNTYSSNEKGGMTKTEFRKWTEINLFKTMAYGTCDKEGKRMCLLADGGPGRSDVEMLSTLRMHGFYIFPSGPPNTTHILQILDMLFGAFKTIYFENLEKLWEYRQNLRDDETPATLNRNDIALLCYGSESRREKDPTFPLLWNAVEEAFAVDKVQHAWSEKLGI